MNRLARLVSIAALSASVALPADVHAFHFPSAREHATKIVHDLRVAGEPKQSERSIDKKGHNQNYIDELLQQLKGRIGNKYAVEYKDDGSSWTYTLKKK